MNLDDNKKYAVFKALINNSFEQVGYEFGFDKHYKSSAGMKNAVHRVFMEVKTDPEKFGANQDVYDMVLKAIEERSSGGKRQASVDSLRAAKEIAKNDVKELLTSTRNDALSMINAKLESIGQSKKKLDAVPLGTLAQVFGILFDKSQILQGEATQNIAVLAKVEKDMPADKLMDLVLNQREHATTT